MSKTAASTNLERETKLEAPAGFRIPELGGDGLVATEVEQQRLVSVYVDTPDLRIVRWGSSLRHRQGEGEDGSLTVHPLSWPSPCRYRRLLPHRAIRRSGVST